LLYAINSLYVVPFSLPGRLRQWELNIGAQIIAFRLNDVRHGTNMVESVLVKYRAAWEKKAMVGQDGLFKDMWLAKQDLTIKASDPAFSAWSCAFMNSWNSKFVRTCYDRQALGYLTTIDGETKLHPPMVGNAYRKLVDDGDSDKVAPQELLQRALDIAKRTSAEKMAAKSHEKPLSLFTKPIFGYVAQWLSELGRPELNGMLKFADDNLHPTWEMGGLYYPRNDEAMDEKLQWTHMDPFSGNAAIGYARLNVEDGIKKIWEEPWTRNKVQTRPWVDGITFANGVDFLRGFWDGDNDLMIVTMKSWDGISKKVKPVFKNLGPGNWEVFVDRQSRVKEDIDQGGEIAVEVEVGSEDVNVVVSRG
jgi:Linalool dehydratase/isomerase